MSERLNPQEEVRARLSALMDGDAQADEALRASGHWRADADARQAWHDYHLIGDALRSSELATPPAHDEAFLQRLRARLADEPVVLAPPPVAPPVALRSTLRRQRAWLAPAAVAAGFVAVAGVLVVLRSPPAPDAGPLIVKDSAPSGAVPVNTLMPGPAGATILVDRGLIRDAGLDRYLSAHRRLGNGAAVAVPGAGARAVEAMAVDGK